MPQCAHCGQNIRLKDRFCPHCLEKSRHEKTRPSSKRRPLPMRYSLIIVLMTIMALGVFLYFSDRETGPEEVAEGFLLALFAQDLQAIVENYADYRPWQDELPAYYHSRETFKEIFIWQGEPLELLSLEKEEMFRDDASARIVFAIHLKKGEETLSQNVTIPLKHLGGHWQIEVPALSLELSP